METIIPFSTLCVLVAIFRQDHSIQKRTVALFPVLFGIVGSLSYRFIVANATRPPVLISFGAVGEKLLGILSMLQGFFLKSPVSASLLVLFYSWSGFVFVFCIIRGKAIKLPPQLIWLACFSFLSSFATISAVSLIATLDIAIRYFIPVFFWPVIEMMALVVYYRQDHFRYYAIAALSILMVFLSARTYALAQRNGISFEYYPDPFPCIDQAVESRGLHSGIAEYWDAKLIQAFSKAELTLAQYAGSQVSEGRWITSKRFFKNAYDFAIINNDSHSGTDMIRTLLPRNQDPKVISCGVRSVYVFGKDGLHIQTPNQ